MLVAGIHDVRIGICLSAWQLKKEGDGEGVPSLIADGRERDRRGERVYDFVRGYEEAGNRFIYR